MNVDFQSSISSAFRNVRSPFPWQKDEVFCFTCFPCCSSYFQHEVSDFRNLDTFAFISWSSLVNALFGYILSTFLLTLWYVFCLVTVYLRAPTFVAQFGSTYVLLRFFIVSLFLPLRELRGSHLLRQLYAHCVHLANQGV